MNKLKHMHPICVPHLLVTNQTPQERHDCVRKGEEIVFFLFETHYNRDVNLGNKKNKRKTSQLGVLIRRKTIIRFIQLESQKELYHNYIKKYWHIKWRDAASQILIIVIFVAKKNSGDMHLFYTLSRK